MPGAWTSGSGGKGVGEEDWKMGFLGLRERRGLGKGTLGLKEAARLEFGPLGLSATRSLRRTRS